MTTAAKEAGPKQKSDVILKYLRPKKKFPSVWCSGCGNGIVMGTLVRANFIRICHVYHKSCN